MIPSSAESYFAYFKIANPESKKKFGLLTEKSQISRSAHRATNTNPKFFLK